MGYPNNWNKNKIYTRKKNHGQQLVINKRSFQQDLIKLRSKLTAHLTTSTYIESSSLSHYNVP